MGVRAASLRWSGRSDELPPQLSTIMYRLPRQFHGEAAEVVAAPLEDCFALLAAVDRYPDWCPDIVRDVAVLDRGPDGRPSRVRMRMRIAQGALVREFDLFLAVVVEAPRTVKLTRVTDHPTNQEFNATWLLLPAGSTRLALQLDAKLRVPFYIPAGGVGDAIAEGFVAAACRALAVPPQ
jgi:ribosome-associated toxin RatA of RatAB toxin-antitoxin module